jgi:MFS family permease
MASFIGDVTRRSKMARAYGWYTTSMQMGMASGPAFGGFIAGKGGYETTFLFSGAAIFIPLIGAVLLLPSLREGAQRKEGTNHVGKALKELGGSRRIVACWLAVLFIAYSFGAFMPFFPLYAQGIGLTAFTIGLLFTIQSIFNAAARVPAGYLSDRLGSRDPFITVGMAVFAISIALLVFFTEFYALAALISLIGLAMGIATMALSTSLAESVKPANRGIAMGGFSTALYGGFALSAAATGWIISSWGYGCGFLLAGLICGIGAVIFYILK